MVTRHDDLEEGDLDIDYMSEEERFEHEWTHGPQMTHTCTYCGCTFSDSAMRGPLSVCNTCADELERGGDPGVRYGA